MEEVLLRGSYFNYFVLSVFINSIQYFNLAAYIGDKELVELLIKLGVNVNFKNEHNYTALYLGSS